MSRKKNGIPDRWLDYEAVGRRLDGTRFIAFKVPLKQSLNRQLPCSQVFGPWDLLDVLDKENQELGLIIDLTFTTRYYKLQDVPESLLFMKIFTAGHEVPSDDTILSFKRTVHSFLRDNAENDKLIGVHCTHGLNRTGYLICRYLIDVDGMDPEEAVELFNSSRGHVVERQNYLEDLRCGPKRSNEGMEESEQEPMRGLAAHRPSQTASDSDSREERRPRCNESRYHRSNQRSHHHHQHQGLLPSPPSLGAPLRPYRWTTPHPDGQWVRPPSSEESRSRYAPPEPERRSRYPPPEESRSRYAPPEESRSRYPPPEERRSRYAPPEESRSRYAPPEESRSRYAPPEERRSRFAPPEPERRSRYPPPEPERRSRYPPPEPERRSRYPPPEPERRSRFAPPGLERRPSSRLQEDRRSLPPPPPPLPRYSPRWTGESNGHGRPEEDWTGPRTRPHYKQTQSQHV